MGLLVFRASIYEVGSTLSVARTGLFLQSPATLYTCGQPVVQDGQEYSALLVIAKLEHLVARVTITKQSL